MKLAERLFIVASILFSLMVIREGVRIPIKAEHTIGPGFLPLVVGIAMAIVSAVMLVKNIQKYREKTEDKPFITKEGLNRLVTFFVILLASLLLNKVVGLVIPLIIFMTLVYRYIEKYSWLTSIKVAVICNVIFYLIFNTWLGVPLPGINF